MIFSERYELGQRLEEWVNENGVAVCGMGYISAITALGYTIDKRVSDSSLGTGSVFDDAIRAETSMKGYGLLQWDFKESGFPRCSIQMPNHAIAQLLEWRDEKQNATSETEETNEGE